jgi:hypothetical protein
MSGFPKNLGTAWILSNRLEPCNFVDLADILFVKLDSRTISAGRSAFNT